MTKSEVRNIIATFGGPAKMARALGIGIGVVQYWRRQGTIPAWRWEQIASAARREGIRVIYAGKDAA
jgi:hypothetical protein